MTIYRKKNSLVSLLFYVVFASGISAQGPCEYEGDNTLWESRFAYPGVYSGNPKAMLNASDGYLYMGGSYSGLYGGDYQATSFVRYNGIYFEEVGNGFNCPGCGSGSIYSMVEDDSGNIYVGGVFQSAYNTDGSHVASRNIARWNTNTMEWEAVGNGLGSGQVTKLAWYNDTLFAIGQFEQAYNISDTIDVGKIAYFVESTGRWEAMGAGFSNPSGFVDGNPRDIVVGHDGTVYVGGGLEQVDTITINSVARWHPSTGWDDWNGGLVSTTTYNGDEDPAYCYALEITPDSNVYAVGTFGDYTASVSVADVRHFAVWNGIDWQYLSGFGKPSGFSAWQFHDLYWDNVTSSLVIGGRFYKYNTGFTANIPAGNRIVRYDPALNHFYEYDTGVLDGDVYVIERYQGNLFIAGNFDKLGDISADKLAYWDGSRWHNTGDGISDVGNVQDIVRRGDDIIATGVFSSVDGIDVPNLAIWSDSTGWSPLDMGLFATASSNYSTYPRALKLHGDELYLGGSIGGFADTIYSTGIGKINLNTGEISGFGSGISALGTGSVYDIEIFQGDLYIAGYFNQVDGVAADNLAVYSNGVWSPVANISGRVYSLHNVGDSVLYVGGAFSRIDGDYDFSKVFALKNDSIYPLAKGIQNGTVYSFAHDSNGTVYVGGNINRVVQPDNSYEYMKGVIAYKNGWWVDTVGISTITNTGGIYDLEFDGDGNLIMAGDFSDINGKTYANVARWNPQQGLSAFGDGLEKTNNIDAQVNAIALTDTFLYVAGDFRRAGYYQASSFTRYALEENLPSAPIVDLPDTIMACPTYTLMGRSPEELIIWSSGDTGTVATFDNSGIYFLTITNTASCSSRDTFYVKAGMSPEAGFTASAQSFLTYNFVDTSSYGNDTVNYSYWHFGDDSPGTEGLTVSHTYPGFGVYTVMHIIANDCGADTVHLTLDIQCPKPVAGIKVVSQDLLEVQFADSSASANDSIISQEWHFGDGTIWTESPLADPANPQDPPLHTYPTGGYYFVKHIIEDACGTDTAHSQIFINCPQPEAGIKVLMVDTLAVLVRDSSMSSMDSLYMSWWNFGDDSGDIHDMDSLLHNYNLGGSYTITRYIEDACGYDMTTVQVNVPGAERSGLNGRIKYDATSPWGIPAANALLNKNGAFFKQSISDSSGVYSFDRLGQGNYSLTAIKDGFHGGANATDALLILRHFVDSIQLTGNHLRVADVSASGNVNSIDALMIAKRFAGLTASFNSPDWHFDTARTFVNGSDSLQLPDIMGLCYGDVNASYQPFTKGVATVSMRQSNKMEDVEKDRVPVYTEKAANIGAFSLALEIPGDMIVDNVVVPGRSEEVIFNQQDNLLRIAWFSLDALRLEEGDPMLYIKVSPLSNSEGSWAIHDESTIASPEGKLLSNTLLIPFSGELMQEAGIRKIYPNPSDGQFTVDYHLPSASDVRIIVLNTLGEEIYTIPLRSQQSGSHTVKVDLKDQSSGIYFLRFETRVKGSGTTEHREVILR